jgi:predicted phosphoribosyltransferase
MTPIPHCPTCGGEAWLSLYSRDADRTVAWVCRQDHAWPRKGFEASPLAQQEIASYVAEQMREIERRRAESRGEGGAA